MSLGAGGSPWWLDLSPSSNFRWLVCNTQQFLGRCTAYQWISSCSCCPSSQPGCQVACENTQATTCPGKRETDLSWSTERLRSHWRCSCDFCISPEFCWLRRPSSGIVYWWACFRSQAANRTIAVESACPYPYVCLASFLTWTSSFWAESVFLRWAIRLGTRFPACSLRLVSVWYWQIFWSAGFAWT